MASRQLQRMGLAPDTLARLHERSLLTARDLFVDRTPFELGELLDLSPDAVAALLAEVAAKVAPPVATAAALRAERAAGGRGAPLPTGLPPLDAALGGGLPCGSVTEVVGPAGLGKTQLCLQAAAAAAVAGLLGGAPGGAVLYLDTERKFSPARLAEILAARFPGRVPGPDAAAALLARVVVAAPASSAELLAALDRLEGTIIDHGVRLVIVDSVAALARADGAGGAAGAPERARSLGRQASRLKALAEAFRIPVLVTNQVTTQVRAPAAAAPRGAPAGPAAAGGAAAAAGGGLTAALGAAWAHAVNTRLVLSAERDPAGGGQLRCVTIAKSPSAAPAAVPYRVTAAGLEWLAGAAAPAPRPGGVLGGVIANVEAYEADGDG